MKEIRTFEELKERSLVIKRPLDVLIPQFRHREMLTLTSAKELKDNCYNVEDGIITFSSDGEIFVIPEMQGLVEILKGKGMEYKPNMYVPFTDGKIPIETKLKWKSLTNQARQINFAHHCEEYCKRHGIMGIPYYILKCKCFEVPANGVRISLGGHERIYYPEVSMTLAGLATDKLGRYRVKDGICVFVHCDGTTYITKSKEVIDLLIASGYSEGKFFVPFNKDTRIIDWDYKAEWERGTA